MPGCGKQSPAAQPKVRINAAASIAVVIEGLTDEVRQDLGIRIEVNSGASGMLTQQIEMGDRPDLFVSADPRWVDRLAEQNLIDPATRIILVSNRLVLIGLPDASDPPKTIESLSMPVCQPIALGDPKYVPAGRYAMQVLNAHGLESGPDLKLAEAPNVRAALAYVKSGQCPTGLVYASDVNSEPGVVVLLVVDPADHDPILYPAVLLADAPQKEAGLRVLDWLQGDRAQAAFKEAGFIRP